MTHIFALLFTLNHVFFVGTMDMEYSKENTFQTTFQLDIDNFEFALEEIYNTDLNLYSEQEDKGKVDSLIYQYLKRHVFIEVNEKILPFTYLGREYENDGFIYLHVESIAFAESINSIKVKNTLLMDVFNQQTNFIKLKYKGIKKSILATKEESSVKLF